MPLEGEEPCLTGLRHAGVQPYDLALPIHAVPGQSQALTTSPPGDVEKLHEIRHMRIERLELGVEELELGQPQEPGARIIAFDLRERRHLRGWDELLLHGEVEAPGEDAQFLPDRAVLRSRTPSCRHVGIETGGCDRY